MSNIDKQALLKIAEIVDREEWDVLDNGDDEYQVIVSGSLERGATYRSYRPVANEIPEQEIAAFIAAANPSTVLALLDENIQLQREKDAIEAVALALRDDMRQAREQLAAAEQERENWRISFDNERYRADKLAAALNAEREKLVMANRSLITQHIRANSAESRIAELEARTVCLPKLPVLGSTAERYEGFADGASSMRNECANAIHAAGIKVEGE
ncbi:ead/Ea22-like family protein [Salmonella enterica]|nr:ead/Ea22-like family protein [Salmonella enterica]